ncbi:MAG: DEAD/DEAH box helicase [Candidatus Woesearchaeota archaeon]
MQYKNLTLDPFQEDAIKAIEGNNSVVVSAPTGSGKTLIADFIIEQHKNDTKRIIYTAPIKALSNQKYRDFSKDYGEDKVGLMTGDLVINPTAKILIMTTEIYRNMVVSSDAEVKDVAYVIFDEIHFINDIERGYVWEESIIYSPETVRFLCLSATIPNAEEFSRWIQAIKHHKVKTVISTERPVPLQMQFYDDHLGLTTLEKIKDAAVEDSEYHRMQGKKRKNFRLPPPDQTALIKEISKDRLPCIFFVFSRQDCQRKAQELSRKNFFSKDYVLLQTLNKRLETAPSEISRLTSTKMLKETLPQGIAFHHAGLLPIIKETIEELFAAGKIKVLYATETFAVGINMPAKTVCFENLRKYDGFNFRGLTTKEFFQMAGRAGRRGIDKIGYAITIIYRPNLNYKEVKHITSKDMEPIQSQFKLSVNTTLNLINQHPPEQIEKILRLSFWSYQQFGVNYAKVPARVLLARYDSITRKLEAFGYVEEGKLTAKGLFSSKVFSDEITTGEIFATDLVESMDEYQTLLVLAALAYESRDLDQFKGQQVDQRVKQLRQILHKNDYLVKERKFKELEKLTALIHPIYTGESFFKVLEQTNLQEGDLIRIFLQILDRVGQIKKATSDYRVRNKMNNCEGILKKALEGIYLV